MSDFIHLQQNDVQQEQNIQLQHVEQMEQPLQNLELQPQQQQQQQQQVPYVRTMQEVQIEGLDIQPPADLAWAYEEERQRMELKAQQENWSQRKRNKEFKDLRKRLKEELKSRDKAAKKKAKQQAADANLQIREVVDIRTREIPVDKDGKILPFSLKDKKERRTKSDDMRVDTKKQILELVQNDARNVFLTPEMKSLVKQIEKYARINATATTLEHWEGKFQATNWFLDHTPRKKYKEKKKQLADEWKLAKEIREKINQMLPTAEGLSREILLDYKARLADRMDGKLDDSNPNVKTLDYTDKKYKLTYSKMRLDEDENVLTLTKKTLATKDRSGEPLFPHEPCAKDLSQRSFGDCYFMTSMGSIVSKHPEMIREMMKDHGDTVTVRFYRTVQDEDSKNWVVEPQFIKINKITAIDDSASEALWVQLMEKAYAVFLKENPDQRFKTESIREYGEQHKAENAQDEIDYIFMATGGQANLAERNLTGKVDQKSHYIHSMLDSDIFEQVGEPAVAIHEAFAGKNDAQVQAWIAERKELKERKAKLYNALLEKNIDATNNPEIQELDREIGVLEKKVADLELNQDVGVFTSKMRMDQGKASKMDIFVREIVDDVLAEREKYRSVYKPLMDNAKAQHDAAVEEVTKQRAKVDQMKKAGGENPSPDVKKNIEKEEARLKQLEQDTKTKLMDLQEFESTHQLFEMEKNGERGKQDAKMAVVSNISTCGEALITATIDSLELDMEDVALAKVNYIDTLNSIRKFNPKEESVVKSRLAVYIPTLTQRCGIEEEKAYEYAKRTAIVALERLIERFDTTFNVESEKVFSGVYTDDAKEVYTEIQKACGNGQTVTVGTRKFSGKRSKGHAGEQMDGGVASNHAYDVLGVEEYEYNHKKIKFVKVRNPWGSANTVYRFNSQTKRVEPYEDWSKTNGIGLVELTHFMHKFDSVKIGTKLGGDNV